MVGFGEGLLKGWQAIDTKIADILLKCVNIRLTKVGIQTCSEEINQIFPDGNDSVLKLKIDSTN